MIAPFVALSIPMSSGSLSSFFARAPHQDDDVIAIGRKGNDALVKNGISPIARILDVSSKVDFAVAKEISGRVAALYAEEKVDAVYAVYNEFKSVLVQNLRAERLLPFDPEIFPGREEPHAIAVDYIYAQPPAELLPALCRAVSKRKSSASCSNQPLRSTARAWPPWIPPPVTQGI